VGLYYFQNETQNYAGYKINASGKPSGAALPDSTNTNYDPTTRPWYICAKLNHCYTKFINIVAVNTYQAIVLSAPVYKLVNGVYTLDSVVAVTRRLSLFTDILAPYAQRSVVTYIMDKSYKLVATSDGEQVWNVAASGCDGKSDCNILARSSVNFYVVTTCKLFSPLNLP
jgi:hypothetical protein